MSKALSLFHPLIQTWFKDKFPKLTDIQAQAWPKIAQGENLLITAPTGSGKTLTAFLWAINQFLLGKSKTGASRVLYISPLKALNNDIQRNLNQPLAELRRLAESQEIEFPKIRVQTRSGDTDASDRRKMLRHPPEILITTPESLNLLLSSKGGQSILCDFETVILDEIHGVISSKRGVYLSTAVERLVPYSGEFQRIILSATINPLDKVARYMAGYRRLSKDKYQPRNISILSSTDQKQYQVTVRYPESSANRPIEEKVWDTLALDFVEKIRSNKSTLLFVNSRALCEKLTYKINATAKETLAYAHHGSLAREIRAEVELKLKEGQLAAIVATSTLEMGIDIGHLDEVILIQSPDGISSAIQRIGRAGHGFGETSRCTIYPTHPLDFIEAAVLSKAVIEGDIEPIKVIYKPLDVLAQIIISMTGNDEWELEELFYELKRSSAYHQLSRQEFDLVIDMLSGRYEDNHIRELRPKIVLNKAAGTIKARRGALLSLYYSGGVIPDRGYFQLRHEKENAKIGELDEEFVWEANIGKIFSLGTQHWQVKKITHNDVVVAPAKPTILAPPFWKSEGLNRDFHYAERVNDFLEYAERHIDDIDYEQHLQDIHFLEPGLATELSRLLKRQRDHCHAPLPHRHHILMEKTQTSPGGAKAPQLILHTGWGAEVNRPFGMALEAAWQKKWGEQAEIWVGNESLVLQLSHDLSANDLFSLVPPNQLENLLRERLEGSGFFGARFRENAGRALLLSKGRFNERKPLWMSRLQSQKLMDSVLKFEDFPILLETWRTCLQDEFDLENLRIMLTEVENATIRISEVNTSSPSPFAKNVAWGQINEYMYMNDKGKSKLKSNLRSELLHEIVFEPGIRPSIDPIIIQEFESKRQRLEKGYHPESAEDLVEWVKERTFIPKLEWEALLALTECCWSDVKAQLDKLKVGVIAREDRAIFDGPLTNSQKPHLSNYLQFYGPISTLSISEMLGIEGKVLEPLLKKLVENQTLISGQLIERDTHSYWCDADNFEILLRFTRQKAKIDFDALGIHYLPAFQHHWQSKAELNSDDTLSNVIDSLRCYPASPQLWETEILPSRITAYKKQMLDLFFQREPIYWLGDENKKISFTFKEDLDLLSDDLHKSDETVLFPDIYAKYDFGALLDSTGLAASELSNKLWTGVWGGKISNDQMSALRQGIESKFESATIPSDHRSGPSRRTGFQKWRSNMPFVGNWFPLRHPPAPIDLIEKEDLTKDRVRTLLDRYGLLFRERLLQESPALQWRNIFRSLRLMELSGEVFSGYFFENIPGLQFISPKALAELQSQPLDWQKKIFWINAADPVSLCGLGLDNLKGQLPRRIASNHIVYDDGKVVLTSAKNGALIDIAVSPEHPSLNEYFDIFRHLLYRDVLALQKIVIEKINGTSARDSAYLTPLQNNFEVIKDYKAIYLQKEIISK